MQANWCYREGYVRMTGPKTVWRVGSIVFLVGLLSVVIGSAVAAPPPSITIDVQANGSAEWTVVTPIDLPSESDRTAFDDMATNETRQGELLAETIQVYQAVANGSSQQVDRDMSIAAETINLRREGATGFITVTFRWEGFAHVEEERLHVGDVFQGGFPLVDNQTLRLTGPDGYELRSHNISSSAASVADREITWNGPATVRSSIDVRFEERSSTATGTEQSDWQSTQTRTATSATGTVTDTTGDTGDGFGAVGTAVAVGALGILFFRRRSCQ